MSRAFTETKLSDWRHTSSGPELVLGECFIDYEIYHDESVTGTPSCYSFRGCDCYRDY